MNGNTIQVGRYRENYNGVTLKGATKVVLNSNKRLNWYVLFAYEFTKLEKPKFEDGDIKFNRNIQILYPGVGVIWKFNTKNI